MLRLPEIIGHPERVREFRSELRSGRIASTYLLVGRDGVGKRTLGQAFAAALLCREPSEDGACGHCEACRCLDSGTHPDLELVERSASLRGRIELKEVREKIIEHLELTPRMGSRRALLVDGAEHLSTEAQNALLKTLEEPPPGSVLLLVAQTEAGLLDTVLSRCRIRRFGRLGEEDCRRVLELQGTDPDAVERALLLADGSPGEALEWMNHPSYGELDTIVRWILEGAPDASELRDSLPGLGSTQGSEGQLSERRRRLLDFLRFCTAVLGAVQRASVQVGKRPLFDYDLRPEHAEQVHRLVRAWFEASSAAMEDLERMVTPELVFERWSHRLPR